MFMSPTMVAGNAPEAWGQQVLPLPGRPGYVRRWAPGVSHCFYRNSGDGVHERFGGWRRWTASTMASECLRRL
jgi:hypothetical protein